jgi:hypothetical protein
MKWIKGRTIFNKIREILVKNIVRIPSTVLILRLKKA